MVGKSLKWHLAGAASIAALCPISAFAQGPATQGDVAQRDTIIVTARKRSESIVDVPISISARSGEELDALAVRDIASAAALIPNLYIDKVPAGPRVSIRGLATSQTGGVVDSSVGLGIDGLFYGRPRWISVGLFDVEAIEVLRGPQSTYFGKNTTAGFINIRTRNPGDEWEGHIIGGYELDIGGYNVEAAAGGPLGETLGVRLAYRHIDRDGYINIAGSDRDDPDYDEDIARATLEWTPDDRFSASYKFTYFDAREEQNAQEIGACDAGFQASLALAGSPEDCELNFRRGPIASIGGGIISDGFFTTNEGFSHSLNASLDIQGFTLSSITGFHELESDWKADADWSTLEFFNINRPEEFSQFSQELRIQSPSDRRIFFVLGGYFDDSDRTMNQIVDAPAFGISFDRQLTVDIQTIAIFGEVTAEITDNLSVTAGLRYTDVDQDGRLLQDGGLLGDLATNYPGSDFDITQSIGSSDVSPSATVQYAFSPDVQAYFSYKQGFKAGGFDLDLTPGASTFDFSDELAESFELGGKADVLDNRVLLTAALFRTNIDDLQVQSYTGTAPTAVILNAASARLQGFEIDALIRATPEFNVQLGIGYTDATYRDFPLAPCTLGQTADMICSGTPPTRSLAGARLPLAPEINFSASADYGRPISRDYEVSVNAAVTHRSSAFLTIENDPLAASDAITLVDGGVTLAPRDGRAGFTLGVVLRNIFDEEYVTGAIALPSPDSWVYQVGLPRTVEVRAGYRF